MEEETTKTTEGLSGESQSIRPRFTMVAKTLAGLEEILADELRTLGARNVEVGRRMVRFEGDQALLYKANFRLRTALRILKPIYEFSCNNIEQLYDELVRFNWMRFLKVEQTFLIDPVVYSDNFRNSRYVSYRVKDALADFFTAHHPEGKRPFVSTTNPDVRFNIHISGKQVTLSIDSSGESLHKRGYKVKQTPAPINEVLAAGILLKAGWDGSCDLIDPMCGSGTFLIEGAMIARNIAAGTWRSHFAFEEWKDFDPILWQSIKEDNSFETPFEHHIYGSDIASDAYTVSQANVSHTGMSADITVERIDFERREAPETPALLIMNPPYGERLNRYDMERLYGMIGTQLKHKYAGSKAWIIAPKKEFLSAIALKPSSRDILFNGEIECELRSFELFNGRIEEYKQDLKEGVSRTYDRPRRDNDRPRSFNKEERPKKFDRPRREEERSHPYQSDQEQTVTTEERPHKRARINRKELSQTMPKHRFAHKEHKERRARIQVFDKDND